jgi:hypothetical protein
LGQVPSGQQLQGDALTAAAAKRSQNWENLLLYTNFSLLNAHGSACITHAHSRGRNQKQDCQQMLCVSFSVAPGNAV